MVLFLDGTRSHACDSRICLENIRECMGREEVIAVDVRENMDWDGTCRYLEEAEAIILAADVYMNNVPPVVLSFLERVEQAVIGGESIGGRFYAVLYTDLYEGGHTCIAMDILKNFCTRANIDWGRGLGIGGNGLKAAARGGRRSFDFRIRPLQEQAVFIREKMQGMDAYVNPQRVSRNAYMRRISHETKKNNRVNIAQS